MRIGAGEGFLLIATGGQGPGSVLSQLVGCRSAGKSTCLVPCDQSRSPRASVTMGLPGADGRSDAGRGSVYSFLWGGISKLECGQLFLVPRRRRAEPASSYRALRLPGVLLRRSSPGLQPIFFPETAVKSCLSQCLGLRTPVPMSLSFLLCSGKCFIYRR